MSQSKEQLYGASGALQLGYANIAILISLLDKLVQRGVIPGPEVTELVRGAMDDMAVHGSGTGVTGAVRWRNSPARPPKARRHASSVASYRAA
jgi:hypothetical protein